MLCFFGSHKCAFKRWTWNEDRFRHKNGVPPLQLSSFWGAPHSHTLMETRGLAASTESTLLLCNKAHSQARREKKKKEQKPGSPTNKTIGVPFFVTVVNKWGHYWSFHLLFHCCANQGYKRKGCIVPSWTEPKARRTCIQNLIYMVTHKMHKVIICLNQPISRAKIWP